MDKIVFRGAQVLYAGQLIEADVAVANGRIAGIGRHLEGDVLSVEGYLVPGLIDEHIHGIHGCDTMSGAQDVTQMARCVVQHGVTTFLPTTMNAPVEETHAAVQGVKDAMLAAGPGADIAGVHMEGPFLSEKYKGAQDARANQLPSMENFQRLTDGTQEIVRLMTLAPELPGAEAFIRAAAAQGIRISAGHSDASYETVESALDWGLSQITHLFNGMPPLHQRRPDLTLIALTDNRVSVEIIADGCHLHPRMVDLASRVKPADKLIGVSNGVHASAEHGTVREAGAVVNSDGVIAGAATTLETGWLHFTNYSGMPDTLTAACFTSNPAHDLGLITRGEIKPGKKADITFLDVKTNKVRMTVIRGRIVYKAEE